MIKRLIEYLIIKRRTEYIQYKSSSKPNNARNYISYPTLKTIRLEFRQMFEILQTIKNDNIRNCKNINDTMNSYC